MPCPPYNRPWMNSQESQDAPVTVSIVLHNQWHLAKPLLEQLERHCAHVIDKVVLTLNVPEPDVVSDGWRFPVHKIGNDAPQGFGANHNAAFTHCRTPWFLVLNPDIRLHDDALSKLLCGARRDAGLIAPRIHEPDKTAPEPYRRLLTPLELMRRRFPGYAPPSGPDWVAGMFMLLRREAFQAVGGFDPRFHMYCEDFDLCARLRLAGWQLQVAGDVDVLHHAQRASQASLRPMVWHLSSLAKVWTSGAFWRYRRLLSGRAAD